MTTSIIMWGPSLYMCASVIHSLDKRMLQSKFPTTAVTIYVAYQGWLSEEKLKNILLVPCWWLVEKKHFLQFSANWKPYMQNF